MKRPLLADVRYALLLCGLFLANCSKVASTDIASSSVYANFTATFEDDDSLTCGVTLRVGGVTSTTYMELSSGETLSCTVGSNTYTLDKDGGLLGDVSYQKKNLNLGANTTVIFTFTRADASTFVGTATIPSLYTFTPPVAIATHAAAFSWTAGSQNASVLMRLSYTSLSTASWVSDSALSDSGSGTVSVATLAAGSYTFTPWLIKTITIDAPAGLSGGSVNGVRTQSGASFSATL